jgi:hypothetical protein
MTTSEVFTNSDIILSGLVVTRYGPWRVEKKRPGKRLLIRGVALYKVWRRDATFARGIYENNV